jgi:uncharacterized SAM-binding protein YcdF (DUF218 family)
MNSKEEFIIILSNSIVRKSDAIVILQGDGTTRIEHGCKLYNKNYAPNLVFSGNSDDLSYGSYPLHMITDEFLRHGITLDKLIHESASTNTKEQANNILNLAVVNRWSSIILVGTHYHQYRAYLTFVQNLVDNNLEKQIKLYNSPVTASWFESNIWGTRYELIQQEFNRIETYKDMGHIASYETAINYIKWVEASE